MCDNVRDGDLEEAEKIPDLPVLVSEDVTAGYVDQRQERNHSPSNDEVGIAVSLILFNFFKHISALNMVILFLSQLLYEEDDPWSLFEFVSRESDGFKRGYKFVEINAVIEHPVTGRVLGLVVFEHPRDGKQFAQYIPLREVHDNAPMELYEYFYHVKGENQFEIALTLVLRKTRKF
ncbi:hypothetical protein KIN20_035090 [Parelaphostrongylus tenuis]|uniref:Uncharacterized protein n=1 Tax=Parelaphostrongylus tenuis TaxID=148309 RepID=A0AAD5WK60_PARTN|nr:hypothetical protein KIN20_035090 [Parelaphostrongylus tenuis]